jgi:hypothetical protein
VNGEFERIRERLTANREAGITLGECAFDAVRDLLDELSRRDREEREAAERSVGGMNLETLERWLGDEYEIVTRSGADRIHSAKGWFPEGNPPLDDDQLLGAILRRIEELGLHVTIMRRHADWYVYLRGWIDTPERRFLAAESQQAPTPLAAVLAAVAELTKETSDGR